MTERLYYRDAWLRAFEARVIERRASDGHDGVVLDATAFYPTGGGQPHDTGTLNDARVLDVQVAEDGAIVHLLDGPLADSVVHGEIDWARRFDHMQQHTGQHILSQAFVQTCQAETVGFHLGEEASTIDVDRAPVAAAVVAAAERMTNELVLGSYPVAAGFVDRDELTTIPLRKMPAVEEAIRIVQVAEFDWSPCGGTHVRNTGQVGPVKVVHTERRKDVTRVYFVCGWRALHDYARKHEITQSLAAHFTTSENEILASVERVESRVKELDKALNAAHMRLLEYQLADWLAKAEPVGALQVIRLAFAECDMYLLREIARRLTERSGTVALLGVREPRAQFVFARSEGVTLDMGDLMRAACATVGGRGGGRPGFAQGGAPDGASVEQTLDAAVALLRTMGKGK